MTLELPRFCCFARLENDLSRLGGVVGLCRHVGRQAVSFVCRALPICIGCLKVLREALFGWFDWELPGSEPACLWIMLFSCLISSKFSHARTRVRCEHQFSMIELLVGFVEFLLLGFGLF